MTTFDELRSKYQGYSDAEILGALQATKYPDYSVEEIGEAVGYKPAPVESPGIIGRVKDLGISALKGAIAVPEAAVGLADLVTGGYAGKAAEAVGFRPKEAKAILSEGYSDAQKRANEEVQKAEGVWDTVKAVAANPSVLAQTITESVPSMLGGGVVAGGLIKGTRLGATVGGRVAASGIGEGVVGAGSGAEQIRQQTEDGLLTGGQAAVAGLSGVATGALGVLGAKVAKSLGIADVDSMLAGAAQDTVMAKGVTRRILEGAISEGLIEELPQSVQEQVAQNYALGKPLDEGVSQAAVLGTLSGSVMGAGANLLPNKPAIQPPKPPPAPPKEEKPAAPLLLGNTPEDILAAPDADSAIATFTASLTGTDMGALMGQDNPLLTASREMQAQTAADEADLAGLVQPAVEAAATVEAPTAMQLALQRAQAKPAAPLPKTGSPPAVSPAIGGTPLAQVLPQVEGGQTGRETAGERQVVETLPAVQRQPDILPGDISREDGTPFKSESGAKYKQRFAGGIDGSEIVQVQGGYVIRLKTAPTDPAAAAPGQAAGVQPAASGVPAPVDPAQPVDGALKRADVEAVTEPISYADARAMVAGKTEKPGGVDPVRQIDAGEGNLSTYRLGQVPLAMFRQNEDDRYDGTVDRGRAADYAARDPKTMPPIIAVLSRKSGTLNVLDGGHRITAARMRGDQSILTLVSLKLTTENPSAQTPEAQQSPPPGQTPAASAAPVPASIPDPVQPAEGGTVPAKAQADPRLIPVSKRAPAQRDDLTDDETTAEFERLYQEDVKADIRRRLGMEPPAKEAKPKASAFRTFLRKYGINPQHASDITGERGVRANNRLPATFRRNGLGLDELALRAVESGYLTQADLESDSDNGGTNKLMEMIQAEIRGERQETTSEAGDSAEAQLESVRRAELEDMATALGIPFDADIDPMALASMVARVQRALDASKEIKGSSKAERMRQNAIAAAQRIEAKRQKYERELEEFAKASIREQNAFLEVLLDDEGTPVVNRLADQQADDAWNELLGAWEDQNGQTETPAEPPSRQAGTPDGAGAAQRPGDAQEGDSGQQRGSPEDQEEGLTAPTRADVLRQQAQTEAEAQRKEQGGDKPVERKVTGDTPDMFNTQGSVFDQPAEAEPPAADPATQATTILDAANVTGKDRLDILKDVKSGALTPDEVQAAYPAAAGAKPAQARSAPQPPEQALKHAKDLGGRVVWHSGDLALIEGYSLLTGDSVYAAAKGPQRTRVDIASYTGAGFTDQERRNLLEAKRRAVVAAQAEMAANPDGPFRDGALVFGDDIPERVQNVVRGWIPLLGLQDARIVVTTPASGAAMAGTLAGRFRRIGKANLSGDNTNGTMQPLGESDFHVAVRPTTSTLKTLEVLAHELGHIAERTAFAQAAPDVQAAIRQAHVQWLSSTGKGTALNLARSMRALRSGRSTGFASDTPAADASAYWKSFGEWFADQVSRWATTQDKPLGVVGQFFKRLADRLRTFFAGEHAKFLPDATVAQWLDSLSKDVPPVSEPVFSKIQTREDDSGNVAMFARSQPFYSALSTEVAKIPAKAQSGGNWLLNIQGLIKAGKVKADEVEWSGVTDFLKLQDGKVTRDQMVAYLDANGVRVEETVLGGGNKPPGYDADIELLSDNGLTLERNPEDPSMVAFMDENGELLSADELAEEPGLAKELVLAAYRVQEAADADKVPTRYANYQLPGGTNYREVLLTLPTGGPSQVEALSDAELRALILRNDGNADVDDVARADLLAMVGNMDMTSTDIAKLTGKNTAQYKSSHWDLPNILAHIRVNDRVDADGKRVLFVEEIQSDWGQAGKKQGFRKPEQTPWSVFVSKGYGVVDQGGYWQVLDYNGDPVSEGATKDEAIQDLIDRDAEESPGGPAMNEAGVPRAPFVTKTDAWLSLALKRVIKMAVDEGYDRVAFVNGEQSAERYDLSKQVDSIYITKLKKGGFEFTARQGGREVISRQTAADADALAGAVGKDLAKKADEQELDSGKTYSGIDLKVGGEGMKAFYDKIVPSTLKDVLRKVGGGALETIIVQTDPMPNEGPDSDTPITDDGMVPRRQPGFTITPAMREKAAGGLPMFDRGERISTGLPAQKVRLMAAPIAKRLHIDLRVVDTPAGLPIPAPSDAVGLYHNGAIYLVASNLNSRAAVMRTLGHEAIAHHGLREMLGDDGFSSMMRQINMAVKAGNPAMRKISEYVRRTYVDEDGKFELTPEQEADEIAARAVEDGIDPASGEFRPGFGWLKGVFAKVAQFLRDLGITVPMSNTELQGVLVNSMRGLEAGAKLQGQGKMAAAARKEAMARKGAQTDSAEFKAWFKDSKVVDADGKPLVVYHGTRGDFSTFRDDKGRGLSALQRLARSLGIGENSGDFFFAADPEFASGYAGLGGKMTGGNIMPVYLSIKSPAYYEQGVSSGSLGAAMEKAKRDGRDGIIVRKWDEAGAPVSDVYIAFDARQIKSAIGNSGAFDPKNPDIRFARSAVTGRPITPTWQAPDPTRMDDMLYSMQDRHIDTKRVVTAVRDAIGGIADNLDPYLQEELYHGRSAMATKEFLEKSIRPLLTDMQARGVEMSDFEEYLHNRHAERRNEQVAKVNPAMPDGGSGIKTADARAYLAGLPAAKRTAYQALARRVDQMNRDTRALLVSSGLEKQATIDAWQTAYGDEYVPLMREEMDNGAMGIGQGFSVRGSSSKRAMGSDKPVANILANIALQREKAITRAEKRRIGEALYGMGLSAPNPDFWIAVDPALQQSPAQITATAMQLISMGLNPIDAEAIAREPRQRYIDPRTGQVAERINPVLRSADNVLAVRIDGEDKYVFFNAKDERAMRMAKSLKNLDSDQLGVVMGNVAKMTRYFAAVNTQYNPVFGVVNLTRDIQTALLNLQSTRLAGKQAEVMKHIGSALRGIYIDLRDHRAGKTPTSTWAGLFEEFQREGGATGYRDMYANAQERADAITDELKKIKQGKAMEFGRGVFGWLSDYNESMENAVRLATYKVAKEQGMSNQQAASIAKNLTVNFNRKGQVALQAGALYAFFNAAVQGTARLAETMFSGGKLSATGKKIMAGGLLLGSMQALLLAAAGYDDEEPPDFVRERSLVIPIGGDKYVSIPMPLGFHVIPNLARIPTEWALGGFRDTPKRIGQLVGLFADAFNPIGSAGLSLQTLAPTIIDPLAALAENRDWTGKPIAKKDFNSMQPTAGHTRAKDTATPWGRAIAYGVNWVTGGTDYKPGMASPTPDQIDYLIGQATGGVGREVSKLSQVAGSTVSGEELPLYKIPLLGRFVGTTAGQAAESGRFYENLKQIGEHDAELSGLKKDRRMAEYQEYMRDNPEARLVPIADRTYREVSKLIRMKRDALKAGASTERIKMLDQQITARMAAFNQRVRATETRETATQE